jgi:hypothetical protein
MAFLQGVQKFPVPGKEQWQKYKEKPIVCQVKLATVLPFPLDAQLTFSYTLSAGKQLFHQSDSVPI